MNIRRSSLCLIIFCLVGSLCFSACHKGQQRSGAESLWIRSEEPTNYVIFSLENNKSVTIQLYPDLAPLTVQNFQRLVKDKFYKGTSFFRAIPNYILQGGDPKNDGTGGPGWTISGEFSSNGVSNPIHHTRGVVSMARKQKDPNSAGSQFFIVLSDEKTSNLDGNYAGFGYVIDGMDTIDQISQGEVKDNTLVTPVKITDCYFVKYPES